MIFIEHVACSSHILVSITMYFYSCESLVCASGAKNINTNNMCMNLNKSIIVAKCIFVYEYISACRCVGSGLNRVKQAVNDNYWITEMLLPWEYVRIIVSLLFIDYIIFYHALFVTTC